MAPKKLPEVVAVEKVSKQQSKRDAMEKVVDYVLESAEDHPKEVVEAARLAKRERARRGERKNIRPDNLAFLTSLAKEKKVWTLAELYTRFEITRSTFGAKYKAALNAAPTPLDRIWFTYNAETKEYTCRGKSPLAPKGYSGPLPDDYEE